MLLRRQYRLNLGRQSTFGKFVSNQSRPGVLRTRRRTQTLGEHSVRCVGSLTPVSVGGNPRASFSTIPPRGSTSFVVKIDNRPGALEDVLRVLRDANVNLTRIESRPSLSSDVFDVFLDAEESNIPKEQLVKVAHGVDFLGPHYVPWFPRQRDDLDAFQSKTLDAGEDLQADHPGFKDVAYRTRRENIVRNARMYRYGQAIPRVEYSESEIKTWGKVYSELKRRHAEYACDEYREIFNELESCGLLSPHAIPQLEDLSKWLQGKTGWMLRPVTGLLSARDFLNGLAVKCFHATQYIRHPSCPFYTPEPDIIHELLGHFPMLANKDFAALSHDIGLASLGASDSDIKRLATCYWFSVEFGLVSQGGRRKAYGAGLLSSFGELEYACSGVEKKIDEADGKEVIVRRPEYIPWDPEVAADMEYPITDYQPRYFVAGSLSSAAELTRWFCMFNMTRPFHARFDESTGQVVTLDRQVKRKGSATE